MQLNRNIFKDFLNIFNIFNKSLREKMDENKTRDNVPSQQQDSPSKETKTIKKIR